MFFVLYTGFSRSIRSYCLATVTSREISRGTAANSISSYACFHNRLLGE